MEHFKSRIKELSKSYLSEAISIRRHFHQHPELSTEEFKTAEFISKKLTEWGIEHQTGIAKTGIVGVIKGNNPDSFVVGLRADMDALPIEEQTDVDYKSQNTGVMHACGHDAHMASLLFTVKILHELRHELNGSVKFIFQPSEEKYPGGAITMINEGVLENPSPQIMLGMHVMPGLSAGVVGFKSGKYMASTDEIYITIKGKGGHAATPNLNIDPITTAAQTIIALQQVVSRFAPPMMPTVLSFGRIEGLGRTNIIPDEVTIQGTIRTFDEIWRKKAHQLIIDICENTCKSFGAQAEVFIDKGYPYLVNDEEVTSTSTQWAKDFVGEANVEALDLRMTAEDFAYFSHQIPSCFYRLGIDIPNTNTLLNLHSNTFNLHENALENSIGLMSWLTINWLKH
ncbi:MAG: M20 family metallopeptidase [Bacteroidota bacterium]